MDKCKHALQSDFGHCVNCIHCGTGIDDFMKNYQAEIAETRANALDEAAEIAYSRKHSMKPPGFNAACTEITQRILARKLISNRELTEDEKNLPANIDLSALES